MIDVSMHYGNKILLKLLKKNNTVNRCEHYFLYGNNVMQNEQYSSIRIGVGFKNFNLLNLTLYHNVIYADLSERIFLKVQRSVFK